MLPLTLVHPNQGWAQDLGGGYSKFQVLSKKIDRSKYMLAALFAYTAVYTIYMPCKRYSMGSRVGRLAMQSRIKPFLPFIPNICYTVGD